MMLVTSIYSLSLSWRALLFATEAHSRYIFRVVPAGCGLEEIEHKVFRHLEKFRILKRDGCSAGPG